MANVKCYLLLLIVLVGERACDQCPGSCFCKWKNGKQTVECVERGLIMIPEGVSVDTQVLDLSNNNLQILPRDTFARAGLTNLQRVFFKKCRIGQIDAFAFRGLTNLIELDLSHNLLTSIPSGSFRDIPFLRDLVLSHNPIAKIEQHAFQPVPGLIKLDLSHCDLQTISPRAFDGIEMLESLKLNSNKLTELGAKTVEVLQRLHGVELHDNPWHCDCRLRSVKEWLLINNIPYPEAPVCSGGPERLMHKTFTELHVDDFACKPEILPVNRHIESLTGNNATILCRANAVPPPLIKWYWNGRLLINNSIFQINQKVFIYEEGNHEKRSRLILPDAREMDLAEFYCVSENRAGSSEVNFTLRVTSKAQSFLQLVTDGKIASLSAFIVVLIIFILLVVFILLIKVRNHPELQTKTPGQIEVIAITSKNSPTIDVINETSSLSENFCNPIQKPPRVDYTSYSTSNSPTDNNPDLINDTKSKSAESLTQINGEYSRNADSSLYPSSLWNDQYKTTNYDDKTPIMDAGSVAGSAEELRFRILAGTNKGYPNDYGLPMVDDARVLPQGTAKTLRVWQKGAVPVLPPVSALKRALISSRNSPDEGYQEGGSGTDV